MTTKETKPRVPAYDLHKINMRVEPQQNQPQQNQTQQNHPVSAFLDPNVDNYIQRIRMSDIKRKVESVQDMEMETALERQKTVLQQAKQQYADLVSRNNPQAVPRVVNEIQAFSPEQLMQLSQLPEEKQQQVISLNMALKGGGGASGQGANDYLLPMIMYSQKNKGADMSDLLGAVEKIMAIRDGGMSHKETSNPMDIVREAMEMAKEYGGMGQQQQPQEPASPFGLLGDPNFATALQTLKEVFGGNSNQDTAQSLRSETLELTKAKNDFELAMRRLDQEKLLEQKKLDVDEKRAEAASHGIERVAATVATALASRGQKSSDDEDDRMEDRLTRPSSMDNVEKLICPNCGNSIIAPNIQPGQTVTCSKCGESSKAE